jgi:hypothetical protein
MPRPSELPNGMQGDLQKLNYPEKNLSGTNTLAYFALAIALKKKAL